jgi:hypothetical protein
MDDDGVKIGTVYGVDCGLRAVGNAPLLLRCFFYT